MPCLTFCYLRAGVHIREKVHFVVLCVFSLSAATRTSQPVCCLPCVTLTTPPVCLTVINERSRNEID